MEVKTVSTIQTQVYQILKDEIAAGIYEPRQRLQEADIAAKFNVSRSPVREAFRQLIAERMLTGIPNKGVFVREFSRKDINEIFEMRLLLENHAIQGLVDGLDEDRDRRFRDILSQMSAASGHNDVDAYMKLDTAFHQELICSCDNELLAATYCNTISLVQQFICLALKTPSRLWESNGEHEQIAELLRTRRISLAAEANREHLETTRDAIVARLFPAAPTS